MTPEMYELIQTAFVNAPGLVMLAYFLASKIGTLGTRMDALELRVARLELAAGIGVRSSSELATVSASELASLVQPDSPEPNPDITGGPVPSKPTGNPPSTFVALLFAIAALTPQLTGCGGAAGAVARVASCPVALAVEATAHYLSSHTCGADHAHHFENETTEERSDGAAQPQTVTTPPTDGVLPQAVTIPQSAEVPTPSPDVAPVAEDDTLDTTEEPTRPPSS